MTDELGDDVLALLPAAEPTAGFADRVMGAWQEERARDEAPAVPRRRRGTALLGALASAAAAAALVAVVDRWPAGPSSGAHLATARAELAIGGRGIAVVEPGADVSWRVARGGDAVVEQRAGAAFYRVEQGGAFVVKTPAGEARVTGTSFSLEVSDMMTKRGAALGGAAAGSVMTAAVLLTVLEGSVVLARGNESVVVGAGERAEASAGGGPRKLTADERARTIDEENRLLAAERRALKEQVADLEGQLKSVMIARSRGEDPLSVENERLRGALDAMKRELSVEQELRDEREGKAVPFPEGLPEKYREGGLKRAFLDILAEGGLPGDVVAIDCGEYPCVVYGEFDVDDESRDARFREFERRLHERYPTNENGHSIRSTAQVDEHGKGKHMFGASVLPKEHDLDEEARKNMHRRLQSRNQQFFEANWGGR